jgi:hypothetical protein
MDMKDGDLVFSTAGRMLTLFGEENDWLSMVCLTAHARTSQSGEKSRLTNQCDGEAKLLKQCKSKRKHRLPRLLRQGKSLPASLMDNCKYMPIAVQPTRLTFNKSRFVQYAAHILRQNKGLCGKSIYYANIFYIPPPRFYGEWQGIEMPIHSITHSISRRESG